MFWCSIPKITNISSCLTKLFFDVFFETQCILSTALYARCHDITISKLILTTSNSNELYSVIETLITARSITCVSVSPSDRANSALSAIDKYCLSANFRSSPSSCCVLNGVRGWRACFCLRNSIVVKPASPPSRDTALRDSAILHIHTRI